MIAVLLFLYGLIIGSFLNALVWRLKRKRDWVRERSECTHCHHVLAAKDLVPVLSWVWLRGRCRYCRKKIDDSPLTELGLAALLTVSYVAWPYTLEGKVGVALFGLWLVLLVLFMVLMVFDFKWYVLPDKLTYGLIPLAIVFFVLRLIVTQQPVSVLLLGSLTAFALFYLLYQVSGGKWIGGGDVKLAISLGLIAGSFGGNLALLFVSSALGTLYAVPSLIRKRTTKNVLVPYGPFLLLATIVVVLWYAALERLVTSILL